MALPPIALNINEVATAPATTDSIMRQLATPVTSNSRAPSSIAGTQVSPMLPGTKPQNMSARDAVVCPPAMALRGVAPERASAGSLIHTPLPDIDEGYAKNRKARASSAGLTKFMPVPPKASLPIITAKAVAMATCQSGIVTGNTNGISSPVARKPSLTSCPRICAKVNSMTRPVTYDTIKIGSTLRNPYQKLPHTSWPKAAAGSRERACWKPTFHMPKSNAGIRAITTTIIVRLRSTASRMCEPVRVTVLGV